jgi:hypothetical protein
MYSLLSVLTGAVLIGLVYGLSFLPTARLAQPDEDVEVAVDEDETAVEADNTHASPGART